MPNERDLTEKTPACVFGENHAHKKEGREQELEEREDGRCGLATENTTERSARVKQSLYKLL